MVDYSKWNKIDVSDDEDDTHPNIDTKSLFRWRHQARVERMQEFQAKKGQLMKEKEAIKNELNQATIQYEQAKKENTIDDDDYKVQARYYEDCKAKYDDIIKKEADMLHEEKTQPWNIDTICHEGFDSSIVSSVNDKKEEKKDEYEGLTEFVEKYKTDIKTFGMLSDTAESRDYLMKNLNLVNEHTANYLCLWCIDLAVEEKWALFDVVTKQTISMQFLLELAKNINVPRNKLVGDFYTNLNKNLPEYNKYFNDELKAFQDRAKNRAKERIQEEVDRVEKEEREKRLGPGGLDPAEVFEKLPNELQQCFESKDVDLLKDTIAKLPVEEANNYMKMCIDSGLWVANADEANEQ